MGKEGDHQGQFQGHCHVMTSGSLAGNGSIDSQSNFSTVARKNTSDLEVIIAGHSIYR